MYCCKIFIRNWNVITERDKTIQQSLTEARNVRSDWQADRRPDKEETIKAKASELTAYRLSTNISCLRHLDDPSRLQIPDRKWAAGALTTHAQCRQQSLFHGCHQRKLHSTYSVDVIKSQGPNANASQTLSNSPVTLQRENTWHVMTTPTFAASRAWKGLWFEMRAHGLP